MGGHRWYCQIKSCGQLVVEIHPVDHDIKNQLLDELSRWHEAKHGHRPFGEHFGNAKVPVATREQLLEEDLRARKSNWMDIREMPSQSRLGAFLRGYYASKDYIEFLKRTQPFPIGDNYEHVVENKIPPAEFVGDLDRFLCRSTTNCPAEHTYCAFSNGQCLVATDGRHEYCNDCLRGLNDVAPNSATRQTELPRGKVF